MEQRICSQQGQDPPEFLDQGESLLRKEKLCPLRACLQDGRGWLCLFIMASQCLSQCLVYKVCAQSVLADWWNEKAYQTFCNMYHSWEK